ncbi:MAG: DUF5683 domain-containing protein [Bacteroidales bacterium]|nr:DUF5683 domain-containing protein [Bacteroidales bacterium]
MRLRHLGTVVLLLWMFLLPDLAAQDVTTSADSTATEQPPVNVKNRTGMRERSNVYVSADQPVETIHTTDSVLQKKHSPKIAIALSAVLPGAGQVYNKKAWKIPIIYGCLGASCYFIYDFSKKMSLYRTEYRCRMQEGFGIPNPELATFDDETVLSMKKTYTRYMEIAIAATGIIYMLNIIDAAVDAHLFYFDISDDLSMHFAPYFEPGVLAGHSYAGISIALKWK